MTTENTYVIAVKDKGWNSNNNILVSNKIYSSKENAEKDLKEDQIILTLEDWGGECFSCGYIDAYG